MCISKTKMLITGTDVRQAAKWMVFIFIYSIYMPDLISKQDTMDRLQTTSLLCFRSRSSFNCRDICSFATCCFVLAQFYSLDMIFFFEDAERRRCDSCPGWERGFSYNTTGSFTGLQRSLLAIKKMKEWERLLWAESFWCFPILPRCCLEPERWAFYPVKIFVHPQEVLKSDCRRIL